MKQINNLVKDIFKQNRKVGWWSDEDILLLENSKAFKTLVSSKLCLVHSEVSEALEGLRKNLKDDHLPNYSMLEVELADVVIRVFDLAGFLGYDLGTTIMEKIEYNKTRADHKLCNREKSGGKTI